MLLSRLSPRQRIVTLSRVRGEEDRGLAGRVAGADDVDVQAVGVRGLAPRGAVEDALSGEPVEAFDRQPTPRDAAGEDDRARLQHVAGLEMDLTGLGVDSGDRSRHEDLGAEPPRLLQRTTRQLVARHAGREAEVVLDPRRRPGLAARCLPLDHEHPQPFRCAVHGRRQPGRPGADDHDVVLGGERLGAEPEQLGHATELRPQDRVGGEPERPGDLAEVRAHHDVRRRRPESTAAPPPPAARRPTSRPHPERRG